MEVYPMRKIDNWVIEQFDKGTTLLQKKGWLPLNTLIMGTECLFWSLLVVGSSGWTFYVISAIGALQLVVGFNSWKDAVGYWENQRKTLKLNAKVLVHRESGPIYRWLCLWVFIPLAILEFITLSFTTVTTSLLVITMAYLRCCRYMGPGDYARQRQTKVSGLPQEG